MLVNNMIQQEMLSSNTAKKGNPLVEFESNTLSVKLTSESREMLDDIVKYLQINRSNAVRMAISKLHKDIIE